MDEFTKILINFTEWTINHKYLDAYTTEELSVLQHRLAVVRQGVLTTIQTKNASKVKPEG